MVTVMMIQCHSWKKELTLTIVTFMHSSLMLNLAYFKANEQPSCVLREAKTFEHVKGWFLCHVVAHFFVITNIPKGGQACSCIC